MKKNETNKDVHEEPQADTSSAEDAPADGPIDIDIEDGASGNEADSPRTNDVEEKTQNSIDEKQETESERYLRLAAEFDNYKKRTAREFSEVVKSANARLLRELIEILDNFERALVKNASENNFDSYRKGVELIYNQLTELLRKENVTPIEAVGSPFDPNQHEAMMQQPSDQYAEGVVAQELQRGYKLDSRVLRHARVIVSSGPGQGVNDTENENESGT